MEKIELIFEVGLLHLLSQKQEELGSILQNF